MGISLFGGSTSLFDISNKLSTLHTMNTDTMQDRYNQVQGKSESELNSMGIQIVDGSYFKDGSAWLTKDWVDKLSGRYNQLLDSSGNYQYPLDIPQNIMGDVVNKYGSTLSKDELIKIARDVYKNTGGNLSDVSIKTAIASVESNTQQSNPDLASKMTDSASTSSSSLLPSGLTDTVSDALPASSKSFLKKYGSWILGGVVFIGLVYFLIPKKKS